MTTMWPMPAAVAPPPIMSRSTTATRIPRRANSAAHAAPTMPAPTTTTSYAGSPMLDSVTNAHTQRITRVEHEFGLRVHKCRPFDARIYLAVPNSHTPLEDTAHNTLLFPGLAFPEFPIRIETRQLCARAGSARRSVISLSRAEHEVFAVD